MTRIAYLFASVLAGVVLVVATAALCFRIHSEPPRLVRDAWPDDVEFVPWQHPSLGVAELRERGR